MDSDEENESGRPLKKIKSSFEKITKKNKSEIVSRFEDVGVKQVGGKAEAEVKEFGGKAGAKAKAGAGAGAKAKAARSANIFLHGYFKE